MKDRYICRFTPIPTFFLFLCCVGEIDTRTTDNAGAPRGPKPTVPVAEGTPPSAPPPKPFNVQDYMAKKEVREADKISLLERKLAMDEDKWQIEKKEREQRLAGDQVTQQNSLAMLQMLQAMQQRLANNENK